MGYAIFFQFVAHMGIAMNRCCVILGRYEELWKGSRLLLTMIILVFLPLPAAAARMIGEVVVIDTGIPNVFAVIIRAPSIVVMVGSFASVLYSLLTCLVSIALEAATLLAYRRLKKSLRQRYSQDYKLLVYALLQLVSQVLIGAYYTILGLATVSQNQPLVALVQSTNPYLVDLLCLSSPICLFTTSSVLRQAYKQTYGYGSSNQHSSSSGRSVILVGGANQSPTSTRRTINC